MDKKFDGARRKNKSIAPLFVRVRAYHKCMYKFLTSLSLSLLGFIYFMRIERHKMMFPHPPAARGAKRSFLYYACGITRPINQQPFY
jgi:hypothetical protein